MWISAHKIAPLAEISPDNVLIHNVRDFVYRTEYDCDEVYKDMKFLLASITGVSYVVTPFGLPGMAHVFVTFHFKDQESLAISFEARRDIHEKVFSPLKGAFNHYELIGVIGTARDLITLREVYRKNVVYKYDFNLTPEQIKNLFVGLLEKVNSLNTKRTMYNTLFCNCQTLIVDEFNKIIPKSQKIHRGIRTLLPGLSAKLFEERKLIDSSI